MRYLPILAKLALLVGTDIMAAQKMMARFNYGPSPQRRNYVRASETYKPNGARECERRRRQIAAGQLTTHNGLVA